MVKFMNIKRTGLKMIVGETGRNEKDAAEVFSFGLSIHVSEVSFLLCF